MGISLALQIPIYSRCCDQRLESKYEAHDQNPSRLSNGD